MHEREAKNITRRSKVLGYVNRLLAKVRKCGRNGDSGLGFNIGK